MQKYLVCFAIATIAMSCLTSCSTLKVGNKASASVKICRELPSELRYIHRIISRNCSDYHGNPKARAHSEAVFKQELMFANHCQSEIDYARAIRKYLATFHDPHVKALWDISRPIFKVLIQISAGKKLSQSLPKLQYTATGIFLQRYQNQYFVKAIDQKLLPHSPVKVGAELKSCNGQTPGEILNREILPYESVSVHASAMYRFTPNIFVRWDQVRGKQILCQFKQNGSTQSISLKWLPVPDNYVEATFQKPSRRLYRLEKTSFGHWITLNSLAGYDKANDNQLRKFVADAKKLRHDRIIVVDIRGNTGGNSDWGTAWIDNLYGYHVEPKIKESVLVTPGNLAHYERLFHHEQKIGAMANKEAKAEWIALLHALHDGHSGHFAVIHYPLITRSQKNRTAFRGRVIVLTDYNVFSSAETFLEQLRLMPGVIQAGVASNASTYFSDVRFEITPGGLPFMFPTKVDSGDPLGRQSGHALVPNWPLHYDPAEELQGVDSLRLALEKKINYLH